MYIRLFRESTTEGGGINPSLAQLESGDGLPKPPSLTEEAEKAAAEAAKTQTQDPSSEEAAKTEIKSTDKPEGEDKKEEDATKEPEKEDPENQEDGAEYYSVVDKITGRQYDIQYPEGIDPVTPEGTAFRENFIRDATFQEFENHLKEVNPRGYAYMLHLQNGGTDEQFFNDPAKGFVLPSLDAMKDSVDVQKAVYAQDLLNRGVDKETVDAIVEKAIKDNKLLERSTASFNFISANQQKFLEEQERKITEAHARTTAAVTSITAKFNQAADAMSFIVPPNKKAEFNQFILNNLQMTEEGKFMFVQEINPDDLKGITESLFFQFAKGDLAQFVQKKVKTEAAHRLKLQTDKTKTGTNRDAGIEGSGKKTLTLGDL